jgi:hypothetical protein
VLIGVFFLHGSRGLDRPLLVYFAFRRRLPTAYCTIHAWSSHWSCVSVCCQPVGTLIWGKGLCVFATARNTDSIETLLKVTDPESIKALNAVHPTHAEYTFNTSYMIKPSTLHTHLSPRPDHSLVTAREATNESIRWARSSCYDDTVLNGSDTNTIARLNIFSIRLVVIDKTVLPTPSDCTAMPILGVSSDIM